MIGKLFLNRVHVSFTVYVFFILIFSLYFVIIIIFFAFTPKLEQIMREKYRAHLKVFRSFVRQCEKILHDR